MNLMKLLIETYDSCIDVAPKTLEGEKPLLLTFHTTQLSNLDIVINFDGTFQSANLIDAKNKGTIIQCTPTSNARTSGIAPHPLHDCLKYLIRDELYSKNGFLSGKKKKNEETIKNNQHYFKYEKLLNSWTKNSKIKELEAIYRYITEGDILGDLIASKLIAAPKDPDVKNLFPESNLKLFIRWHVGIDEDLVKTYNNVDIMKDWIVFYKNNQEANGESAGICQVTGEKTIIANNHPSKIRTDGDRTKIISYDDDNNANLSFNGRFNSELDAFSFGEENSTKAHNALKWLISKQGQVFYENSEAKLTIVAWSNKFNNPINKKGSFANFDFEEEDAKVIDTFEGTSKDFIISTKGYLNNNIEKESVYLLMLNSFTKGRMSIEYFGEMSYHEYLENLKSWKKEYPWSVNYYRKYKENNVTEKKEKITEKSNKPFLYSPSAIDITRLICGIENDNAFYRHILKEMTLTILENRRPAKNIVNLAYDETVKLISLSSGKKDNLYEQYGIDKAVGIACSLYNKYHKQEVDAMHLDENKVSRSYLYGRLLAVAHDLEMSVHIAKKIDRPTIAEKRIEEFTRNPSKIWFEIYKELLSSYLTPSDNQYYFTPRKNLIQEIILKIQDNDEFLNKKPLNCEFLMGYHHQLYKLQEDRKEEMRVKKETQISKKEKEKLKEDTDTNENDERENEEKSN